MGLRQRSGPRHSAGTCAHGHQALFKSHNTQARSMEVLTHRAVLHPQTPPFHPNSSHKAPHHLQSTSHPGEQSTLWGTAALRAVLLSPREKSFTFPTSSTAQGGFILPTAHPEDERVGGFLCLLGPGWPVPHRVADKALRLSTSEFLKAILTERFP